MSFSLTSKRFSSAFLALAFLSGAPLYVLADAPPGAYLQSTTKTQTQTPLAGSAQKNQSLSTQNSIDSGSGTKYGQPLSNSMNDTNNQSSQNSWNGSGATGNQSLQADSQSSPNAPSQNWPGGQPNMGWQSMPPGQPAYQPETQSASSGQYSGYAQQSTSLPAYAPQPNYPSQQSTNAGGAWQPNYPPAVDMNGGQQQMAPPSYNANAQYNQPQYPLVQVPQPLAPVPVAAKPASDPDDGTSKTLSAIANTVLPIATSVVTNAIMNKMMYGSMMPGYGNSMYGNQMYGNQYGGMRNPMGGYGYNRPNILNGMMGGGNGGLGGLLNTHY